MMVVDLLRFHAATRRDTLLWVANALIGTCVLAMGAPDTPVAPPTPPGIVMRRTSDPSPPVPRLLEGAPGALYGIGQPTDEEQLHLEYINRARANPPAEGVWLGNLTDPDVLAAYEYYGVNLSMMISQFNTNPPVPPLSFHSNLITAARGHSRDMLTNAFQGHLGSDGRDPGMRLDTVGYVWNTYGENVYASARSVLHGHAGFNVDWGAGPGGMQSPPGHRNSILSQYFREVGLGVVMGYNSRTNNGDVSYVGPQIITQDFASRSGLPPLITGVVYFDLNGNSFYDLGEGLGGIRVEVSGSSYYALSANSGGYTVPASGDGTPTVTFWFDTEMLTQKVATVSGGANVKVDFVPGYAPPQIAGPLQPSIGLPNHYSFTAVLGASNYQWRSFRLRPYPRVEGAESGSNGVRITASPGYSVFASDIKYAGTYAFHLAHPAPPVPQLVEVSTPIRPRAGGYVRFASRLTYASTDQRARLQVSADDGASWQNLWSQAGSGGPGESSFTFKSNSLAPYSGRQIRVRFNYDFSSGSYFPQTSSGVGWYFDEIVFGHTDVVTNATTNLTTTTSSFVFTPANTNRYLVQVRALLPGRRLPFGPEWAVTGVNRGSPTWLSWFRANNTLVLRWPTNHPGYVLQGTDLIAATNTWTNLTAAVQGTNFQAVVTASGGAGFYRLRKP